MWNVMKLVRHYGHVAESTWFNKAPQSPDDAVGQLKYMLTMYSVVVVALCCVVAWFVTFIETDFWRKAALLFLLMITAPPAGADYKLVHAVGAATALIIAAGQRSGDLLPVMLTAAVLCPKKYWFFPDIITDMMATDCSVGVVINPILIWVAAGVLIYQGFREWNSAGPVGAGPPRGAGTRLHLQ
jgi:hypothetical protein